SKNSRNFLYDYQILTSDIIIIERLIVTVSLPLDEKYNLINTHKKALPLSNAFLSLISNSE
ncbi:hypothetical protein, partial [Pseudoalteromonas nigrifaciens]|uniref:hypothetical protein n=1 Tax=Pseudoalteromonas nigrifaciens TaxID=28109 RepID=UPI003F94F1CD